MGINVKKKGNLWENKLANWLFSHGIKSWRDGASGGGSREKGDVGNNIDCTIESKCGKNISLMDWWRQVEHSASIHGNQPVLFIHQDGMKDNEWLTVMHSEDWIEMMKKSLQVDGVKQVETPNNREMKYKTERAIYALKDLFKTLGEE